MRIRSAFLFLTLMSCLAAAASLPYNEHADAKAEVRQALLSANRSQTLVLIIFGANWCEDCRALDAAMKSQENAELLAKTFQVVKVDVGNFDRNRDLAASYGNPTLKGIPAAIVLSPDNQLVYSTRGGELADARRMSNRGIYDFFSRIAQAMQGKK